MLNYVYKVPFNICHHVKSSANARLKTEARIILIIYTIG